MDSLLFDQTFTNNAVMGQARIDTRDSASTGGKTLATVGGTTTLSIQFNASTGSYTLSGAGLTQVFTTADRRPDDGSGDTRYRIATSTSVDFLTLDAFDSQRYVRVGYWQHNVPAGADEADITFIPFAYGFETPASAIPRSGYGGYLVNLFGFFTPPGSAPKVVDGIGEFRADFASGLYSTTGTLAYESYLLVDYYTYPYTWESVGGINADGSFSGQFVYNGSERDKPVGRINGRFYGPNLDEIGAAVTGANAAGASFSAVLTGGAANSVEARDMTNRTSAAFQLPTIQSGLTQIFNPIAAVVGYTSSTGRFTRDSAGTYSLELNSVPPGGPTGVFAAADRVAAKSDGRATVYERGSERLTLYNPRYPGLDLTYASFGLWEATGAYSPTRARSDTTYFAYGHLAPPHYSLRRTGTASYAAQLLGRAVHLVDSRQFEVSGDMSLAVDFSTMNYTGALHAAGADIAGGAGRDYGSYTFSGKMDESYGYQTFFGTAPGSTGDLDGRLYGPSGEETAAQFQIFTRQGGQIVDIVRGLAVGKRQ